MKMKFEIRNAERMLASFEDESTKGINTLMKSIADYRVDLNENPYAGAETICKRLMRGEQFYIGDRTYQMRGMRLMEFGKLKGWTIDECTAFAKGTYSEDYIRKNIDTILVNRYMLLGDKPFREVDKMYNDEYAKNDEIGTIYDWLDEAATIDDLKQYA